MAIKYLEDYVVGEEVKIPAEYVVPKDEVIAIATKWNPQPYHIDEEAAKASIFGGLTASAAHVFSIYCWLTQQGEDQGSFYLPMTATTEGRPGDL